MYVYECICHFITLEEDNEDEEDDERRSSTLLFRHACFLLTILLYVVSHERCQNVFILGELLEFNMTPLSQFWFPR